jgi:hypothetical protein
MMNEYVKAGLGVALVSAAGVASADTGIDVSTVVTTIGAAVTACSTLGLAVLSLVVTVKTFKWAKSAL